MSSISPERLAEIRENLNRLNLPPLPGLEPPEDAPASDQTGRITMALVQKMFPGARRENLETYFPPVLRALGQAGLSDPRLVLMALATIRAESAGFQPISEMLSRYNTSPGGRPFDLYDHRRDLGNQGPPDGERFRGRGFVQLTGRFNYGKFSEKLGLGTRLLEEPELANDPEIAARLLAAFIADQQARISLALERGDLRAARRAVNGGSHGLARFSEAYRTGLTALRLDQS